jgi:CheY-specific phosphatase CheX
VIATIVLMRDPPGSLSLVLPRETAARLASRYLPPGTAIATELIDDVAGEFANVIAGQAKTMLKGSVYHFFLSTPVVERVAAEEDCTAPNPNLTARLHSEIGVVVLQVCLPDGAGASDS